ncbi:VOC family protein [Candidatus Gracilibacteria bacterium]|nr:VOC family protein [Candidatus Gracilibacteria bacterium]
MTNKITGLDFVGVPSQDSDRSIKFYTETLGLRVDDKAKYEFWVGDTCFAIWEPAKLGMPFTAQKNAHIALNVENIEEARKELEDKGIVFRGETINNRDICFMALFTDPDGNDLMLHQRA